MSQAAKVRVVFFGMRGDFSLIPLQALLAAGVDVCGVVVPAPATRERASRSPIERILPSGRVSPLPLANPYVTRTIVHLAFEHDLPVWELTQPNAAQTLHVLAALEPDLGCMACFPQRLPAALLALPRHGFVNVHPSLLPAYRGPAPLFWTLHNGDNATGVTLHMLDQGLDTGDIVLQAPLTLPDGVSGPQADRLCASLGAQLLLQAIHEAQLGRLQRIEQPLGGSYAPWPTSQDFRLDICWPARRIFNFMRATADWQQPYPILVNGAQLRLTTALAYAADAALGTAYLCRGNEVRLQCTPGVLHARRG